MTVSIRRLLPRILVSLAVAVALAACGSSSETGADNAAASVDTSEATAFVATTVYGAQVDVDEVTQTDAVLWFWAPW